MSAHPKPPFLGPTPDPNSDPEIETRDAATVYQGILDTIKQEFIGQEESLRRLALVGTAHILAPDGTPGAVRLLIGPTGSGKSTLLREFGRALSLPVIQISVPRMTATGWTGTNVEDVVSAGLTGLKAGTRPWRRPILVLDDAQHIRIKTRSDNADLLHQMNRQASLLDLLSGTGIIPTAGGTLSRDQEKNWTARESLRIVAGAFGLTPEQLTSPLALEEYGFIPELANRLAQPAIHLQAPDSSDIAVLVYLHHGSMIQEVFKQLGGECLSIDGVAAELLARKVSRWPGATPRTALLALEAIWEVKVLEAIEAGNLDPDGKPLRIRVTRKDLAGMA